MSLTSQTSKVARVLPALGIGAVPLTALNLVKSNLALDRLHIALIEVLFLMVMHFAITWTRKISKSEQAIPVLEKPTEQPIPVQVALPVKRPVEKHQTLEQSGQIEERPFKTIDQIPATEQFSTEPETSTTNYSHPKYPAELLDTTVCNLLELVEPDSLGLIGVDATTSDGEPRLPLAEWDSVFKDDIITVAKHPKLKAMYAISSRFPTISLRDMWETVGAMEMRTDWDNMCDKSANLEKLGKWPPEADAKDGRQATIDYLALKGFFPVKAKDMVMMTAVAQLPSLKKDIRRLIRATRTVEHAAMPPQPGFQRMEVSVSGFLMQDDGTGGCVLTQVTDISSLGSWIPTKIINLVTTKLLPKSLQKMGEAASTIKYPGSRRDLTGDAWLPPPISRYQKTVTPPIQEKVFKDSPDPQPTASESRAASHLVRQIRLLESRIGELESEKTVKLPTKQATQQSWWLWLMPWRQSDAVAIPSKTDLGGVIRNTIQGAFGGFLGSAALVALVLTWQRRIAR